MTRMLDEDSEDLRPRERELTLSTGTLLGIFLALVLLCGAFFGFGYRLGSRSSKTAEVIGTANAQDTQPTNDLFNSFKPAAGSPASSSETGSTAGSGPETGSAAGSATGTQPGAGGAAEAAASTATPVSKGEAPSVAPTPEAPVAAGQFVVQVAAVSHEEDVELLVSALRAKGYPVSAHTEPQDKFFHIQVGPFTSLQEANVAKQRLLADGYQPIIK